MANTNNETISAGAPAREPDDLLTGVRHSILGTAMLFSTVIHLVLIGLTSFGLYRDWGQYGLSSEEMGFHTPSDINILKSREKRAADEAERQAKAEARAAEAAARAATNAPPAAAAGAATPGSAGLAPAAQAGAGATVKAPEVEPLPPVKDFTFGEDLKLD